ncbi:MAG: TatD family hydrolase [Treponema sp.]|nr:TatD family hydrolase [Treponema sp.]
MNIYCDSHIHLFQCHKLDSFRDDFFYKACSSAKSQKEYFEQKKCIEDLENRYKAVHIYKSFGVHPQFLNFMEDDISFLIKLLESKSLSAVGEIGFDFYKENRNSSEKQILAWEKQLELAIAFNLPIVIHCRKALDMLFRYSNELKKLSAVVFHAFPGNEKDALSLLNKGINGFFSIGKTLIKGDKSVFSCVQKLPLEKLLIETDAPYQALYGEKESYPLDIMNLYDKIAVIRSIAVENIMSVIEQNFISVFER